MKTCRIPLAAGVCGALMAAIFLTPLPRAIRDPAPHAPVSVLDRDGRLLYEARQPDYGSENPLPLSAIPATIIEGLIAIEDRTFRRHHGISARGILRAAIQNAQEGHVVSGGSTITQQLVRIRLHPARRTVLWKLREMRLALKLDATLSKDDILKQYLNSAYFGHQAYGLRSASQIYFKKEPAELSLAESALLIGLLQSPAALDPFRNLPQTQSRRNRVLAAMEAGHVITAAEAEAARGEPVRLADGRVEITAPHFVFWVLSQMGDSPKPGAAIRTTLDIDLQHAAERIVARRLTDLKEKNATSAAVVVLDAAQGDVLAMVGSADYFDASRDGAVNVALSPRQPGSALKPFTYALALAQEDTAATTVADTEIRLLTEEGNPYTPRNYDYDLHGLVRYREALANSYNIPAVKVLERVGVPQLLDFLLRAGITTLTRDPAHYGLALALGSGEVTLLELARAYGVFARGGRTLGTRALLSAPVAEGEQILDERVAWIISDILSDASARLPEFGENTPLSLPPHRIAAKTGTTRNARDNWVIGFTPDRIVGVWVGNADNSPMKGTSGITGAGPIFHDVMEAALRWLPPAQFPRPAGIATVGICRLSGKLPTPSCPHTIREVFIAGTEPSEPDDMHLSVKVDSRNGLLAGDSCPAASVQEQVFTVFPGEVRAWARERGYREPPAAFSPLCGDDDTLGIKGESAPLRITRPREGDSFLLDSLVPDADEEITLEARADDGVSEAEWFVDGEHIGTGRAPDYRVRWRPVPGKHRIETRAGGESDGVDVEVME